MPVSEKQKAYAKKWDKENLHTVSTRLRMEDFELYKELCAVRGVTVTSEIKKFVMKELDEFCKLERIYIACGGLCCIQPFVENIPGVIYTEDGIADGISGQFDNGYSECVKIYFDPEKVTVTKILEYLFDVITQCDNFKKNGTQIGINIYCEYHCHIKEASAYLFSGKNLDTIMTNVGELKEYHRSDEVSQFRSDQFIKNCNQCHAAKII